MSQWPVTPPLHASTRFKQLDSMRGLAALFVFFSHYVGIFRPGLPFADVIQLTPLGILYNGRAAVMFFFSLSGFVLALPFIGGKPIDIAEFYIKRIGRIYPAYIVAILFALLLKLAFFDHARLSPFSSWLNTFWNWSWNSQSLT